MARSIQINQEDMRTLVALLEKLGLCGVSVVTMPPKLKGCVIPLPTLRAHMERLEELDIKIMNYPILESGDLEVTNGETETD
jgi:hypothetical protein